MYIERAGIARVASNVARTYLHIRLTTLPISPILSTVFALFVILYLQYRWLRYAGEFTRGEVENGPSFGRVYDDRARCGLSSSSSCFCQRNRSISSFPFYRESYGLSRNRTVVNESTFLRFKSSSVDVHERNAIKEKTIMEIC